jgi:hypothetical protein
MKDFLVQEYSVGVGFSELLPFYLLDLTKRKEKSGRELFLLLLLFFLLFIFFFFSFPFAFLENIISF